MIDARAIVSAEAELAANVCIGPFSIIGPQVRIGPRTVLGPRCEVHPFAVIGGAPQDRHWKGEPTAVVAGADNIFREGVTVNAATGEGARTVLGDRNFFMAYAHVAHDCVVGNNTVFANCAALGGHVEIGDWAILGGLTAVHQFTKIGAHAFLAGGAIVTRDVPPYVMVAGNPAAPHAVNSEGLKRRGFTEEQIRNIRDAYRIVYRSDLKLAEALARLAPQADGRPEIRAFVDFIHASTRSLAR